MSKYTRNKKKTKEEKKKSFKKVLESAELLPKPLTKAQVGQLVKRGRPSKYQKGYCERVIVLMSDGKSRNTVAAELGIHYTTLLDWEEQHEEFAEALQIGHQLSERWWYEVGRLNLHNKDFNSTLYMMNMSNQFGWSRKVDNNINDGKPLVDNRTVNVLNFERTDEHTAEVAKILVESGAVKSAVKKSVDSKTH